MTPKRFRWRIKATDGDLTEIIPPTPVVLEQRPGMGGDAEGMFFLPWKFSLHGGNQLAWVGVFDCQKPVYLTLELASPDDDIATSWVFNNVQLFPTGAETAMGEGDYQPVFRVEFDSAVYDPTGMTLIHEGCKDGKVVVGRMYGKGPIDVL